MDASKDRLYFGDVRNCRIRAVDLHTGIIDTVAGVGNEDGDIGDGLAAIRATVSTHPMRVSLDDQSHLYIADAHQARIRRVDAVSGIISTVAGNGEEGFAGDGGLATQASLFSPHAARVDRYGHLYIADTQNDRVRKVCGESGVITTVAGDGRTEFSGDGVAAVEASLSGPLSVDIDDGGHLFIVDRWHHRIRRVDAMSGIISTVAGTGAEGPLQDGVAATAAEFMTLRDILFGPDGHLYIVDGDSSRIGRLDLDVGRIEIVAGNGTAGFSGDGGPAVDACLDHPYSAAFDPSGHLYIFDTQNSRIRKVDAVSGIISTVAGNGTTGFSGDGGPATDATVGFGG